MSTAETTVQTCFFRLLSSRLFGARNSDLVFPHWIEIAAVFFRGRHWSALHHFKRNQMIRFHLHTLADDSRLARSVHIPTHFGGFLSPEAGKLSTLGGFPSRSVRKVFNFR